MTKPKVVKLERRKVNVGGGEKLSFVKQVYLVGMHIPLRVDQRRPKYINGASLWDVNTEVR